MRCEVFIGANFILLCLRHNLGNTIRHLLPLGLMHPVNVGSQLLTSLAEVYTAGGTEDSAKQIIKFYLLEGK